MQPAKQQAIRRHFWAAWLALVVAFVLFCAVAFGVVQLVRGYFDSSTNTATATLSRVPSTGTALYTERNTRQWRLFADGKGASADNKLTEGDGVRTDDETNARLSFPGGITATLYSNSIVLIRSLQTSSFSQNEAIIELVVVKGLVQVDSSGQSGYSHQQVIIHGCAQDSSKGDTRCPTYQDIAHTTLGAATANSVRVQVGNDPFQADAKNPLRGKYSRTTVLSGTATVEAQDRRPSPDGRQQIALTAKQMSTTGIGGPLGGSEDGWDELLVDGNFHDNLLYWGSKPQFDPGEDGDKGPPPLADVILTDTVAGGQVKALSFSRCPAVAPGTGCDDYAAVLVGQLLNRDVRPYSTLRFEADLKLQYQDPPGGGSTGYEFPVILKITYTTDADKGLPNWVRGYYFQCEVEVSCLKSEAIRGRSQKLEKDNWQHVTIDNLRSIPLLKDATQIVRVEFYAAGHKYQSLIANVSLKAR